MNNNRKSKLQKLNFYIVDDKYIEYLSQFEKHIAYNKNGKRPYIGIVFTINEHYYFAPLFSPKEKHKTYKDNLSFFKIENTQTKESLGIIRFSDMIPVPQESVYLLDIRSKSYGYKRLLSKQYSFINIPTNREKIFYKAEKLYQLITSKKETKLTSFYKKICCNYKLLEENSSKYNN